MFLADTRDREFRLKDQGVRVVHKSIAEIREEFEQNHGSIWLQEF